MSKIQVAKFGGTSVADTENIGRVIAIIRSDPTIKYVVVSAPAPKKPKLTDLFILCHQEAASHVPFASSFKIIADVFRAIAKGTGIDIETELKIAHEGIRAGQSLDWVASRGEYLNAKIIARMLGIPFVDAFNLIYFGKDGKVDENATSIAVKKNLCQHPRAVIPGFYGRGSDGTVKLLPRNGSDITGAIIAWATRAHAYCTYKDVTGVYRMDPGVIPDSVPIVQMTYAEARELCNGGAKVLHPDAIPPVKRAGIVTRVLSTLEPGHPGTIIVPDNRLNENPRGITGMAGRGDFSRVTLTKTGMNEELGFASRVLAIFEESKIPVEHIPTSVDTLSVVFQHSKHFDEQRTQIAEQLRGQCKPDAIAFALHERALITVVGKEATATPTVQKAIAALAENHIPLEMLGLGSSKLSMTIGVPNAELRHACKVLYAALCA